MTKKKDIEAIVIENNNLYDFSRNLIINSRKVIYQAANFQMVETYWRIGEKIVEEQGGETYAKYGENLLIGISARLSVEFGKSYSYVNLTNMRKFHLQFPNVYALRKELSWTHYRSLIRVENPKAREVYMDEAANNSWSTRFLDEQVDKHFYERLISTHKEAVNELNKKAQLAVNPQDYILKDPLLLDYYGLKENTKYNESNVEQLIIDNLQKFLLELGRGFSFVARQQRITTEFSHYFIDLVFYNYILKCFVLIDLKIGKLTHQDIGQMDMYVRMYDKMKCTEGDNPTIGIILCEEKDRAEVKFSILNDSEQLFATKYKLYIPTEEELIREITQIRSLMNGDAD
ncbi:MAG: PDDEXK nuclease domain-containing protein [Prevotellaceae bacterium]|jgi:predicted nuclease of restriction endonuclease-like (RecB) superfamily|nr:PDDEXK nuclease domain-containing protein [Prevotellaceae bacterium]